MDIWLWVVIIVAAVLVAFVILGTRGARSGVDPTQVSIDPALATKVRELYAKGDRLQAVKDLRAATGLKLADAIRIADKLGAGAKSATGGPVLQNASPGTDLGPDHRDEIESLVRAGNKIEAIKRVRELTGLGLKEAKGYVDRL